MDIYSHILKPLKKENKLVIRNYITWAKHSAFGINSELALSYPKETEKAWFVMKGQDWNNNNAEFFNTKYEKILQYMQEQAEQFGITSKDIHAVCGVQMYSHWFTKSQFTIIPERHYMKLREHYKGGFAKSYEELRSMIGDHNPQNGCLKPYFDNIAAERVGDIGLTDVWRFSVTSGKEKESAGGHATPKPLALCARAIKASSREEEVVLDVFGGSGSTMIACEQLNRKCCMMELEPKWVDVIIARWEQFTGEKAVLLND
jgi:DNA modification methylase